MARAGYGSLYADDAREFAKSFPTGKSITAKELDLWGMDKGLLTKIDDYDATPRSSAAWVRLVAQRSKLRRRINAGATSEVFMNGGGSCQPFSIDVDLVGETYLVRDAEASLKDKTRRIPRIVTSFTRSKVRTVEHIKQAVNVTSLPPGTQLELEQIVWQLDDFERDVEQKSQDLERRLTKVVDWIRRTYGPLRLSGPDDGES